MNAASCRVAEHAGFPLEGTKRGESLHRNSWRHMHLHARWPATPRAVLTGMMPGRLRGGEVSTWARCSSG